MGSSGKQKTTTAKRVREARLRERRLEKQAKKDARRQAATQHADPMTHATESPATSVEGATADSAQY